MPLPSMYPQDMLALRVIKRVITLIDKNHHHDIWCYKTSKTMPWGLVGRASARFIGLPEFEPSYGQVLPQPLIYKKSHAGWRVILDKRVIIPSA